MDKEPATLQIIATLNPDEVQEALDDLEEAVERIREYCKVEIARITIPTPQIINLG